MSLNSIDGGVKPLFDTEYHLQKKRGKRILVGGYALEWGSGGGGIGELSELSADPCGDGIEGDDDKEDAKENGCEAVPLGEFLILEELESNTTCPDVPDDTGGADIVFEHPEGMTPDEGSDGGP